MNKNITQNIEGKSIKDVAKEIYASLSFGAHKVEAHMNLCLPYLVEDEILALALQHLLMQSFRIQFPATEMRKVSIGQSVSFVENKPTDGLPARTVSVLLDSEYRGITVTGVLPERGKDGSSELHFKWKRQAGSIDDIGNINFNDLNKFPTVQQGEILATIRARTSGKPGSDVLGKKLKPRPGISLRVQFDKNTIEKRDNEKEAGTFCLYAKKTGIIDFKLQLRDNPCTLVQLTVLDTITINHDIDCSVGDLNDDSLGGGGAINIVVKGDVCGRFTLKSNGYISISGHCEAQKIQAENIQINVVTAGCKVVAGKLAVVGTLIMSKVYGEIVKLKRAASNSEFVGEKVYLEKKTNCHALTIRTRNIVCDSNKFSSRTLIVLGEELFSQEKQLLKQIEGNRELLSKDYGDIVEMGEVAIYQFRQLKLFIEGFSTVTSECREQLMALKESFQSALKNLDHPLSPKLINQCYSFQNLIKDPQTAKEFLPRIQGFVEMLQRLNKALRKRCVLITEIEKEQNSIQGLRQETEQLCAAFEEIKFAKTSSEVVIQCGLKRIILNSGNLPDPSFQVNYELIGKTGIRDGELVFEESF